MLCLVGQFELPAFTERLGRAGGELDHELGKAQLARLPVLALPRGIVREANRVGDLA